MLLKMLIFALYEYNFKGIMHYTRNWWQRRALLCWLAIKLKIRPFSKMIRQAHAFSFYTGTGKYSISFLKYIYPHKMFQLIWSNKVLLAIYLRKYCTNLKNIVLSYMLKKTQQFEVQKICLPVLINTFFLVYAN